MSTVMSVLNQATPVEERDPFLDPGTTGQATHKLIVLSYGLFKSTKHGEAIGAKYLVVESKGLDGAPVHAPGSIAAMAWFHNKPDGKFPGQTLKNEVNPAVDFAAKLLNVSCDEAKPRMADAFANAAAQPFRGRIIEVTCVRRTKTKPDGSMSKWIERTWKNVAMTDAEIAQVRGSIDRTHPYVAQQPQQAAPAPQMPQQPQYPGYPQGQYPGYPPAAAPQQPAPQYPGYPPAPQYPGYAPAAAPTPPAIPGLPGFPGFPPGNGAR